MSASNRERRRANQELRREAQAAARRRARQQRWGFAIGALVVAVAVAIVLVARLGEDDDESGAAAPPDSSTSTIPAAKACVAVADPLPEGAPEVPVKVGPAPTTLVTEDLVPGTGDEVTPGASVTANYIGVACSTGKIFDSSYASGAPVPFSLTQVIKGWTDGIPGMKVGGQRLLGIPADQAYGADGFPPDIGPNEALWFVVEIVSTQAG